MKKLLKLLRSLFKLKHRKREHSCEELDSFFSFSILLLTVFLSIQTADAVEIYFFSQHSDMKNSKANEYVDFKSSENTAGLGFATHIIQKDKDKLDLRVGLGKSNADIKISQTVNVLNKVYSVKLNYNTSMYLFNISYSYRISKSFSIQAEFEQSKNALKRDTYMIKLSYQF